MNDYLHCPICDFAHAGVVPAGHAREQTCSTCGKTLELAAFPIHASAWNGHRKTCSTCLAPQQAAKKAADKAARIARYKERAAIRAIPASTPANITYHELFLSRDEVARDAAYLCEQGALVLDTETTGLSPSYHRMVSLSVVRLASGELLLDTLINPRRPIPAEASAIHHIYDSDVQEAPSWYSVWRYSLLPLLHGTPPLVIFNARFDMGFIESAVAQLRQNWTQNAPVPALHVYCAMKMAASWNKAGDRISLRDACMLSNIALSEYGEHSARGDARATRELLLAYAGRTQPVRARPTVPDIAELRRQIAETEGSLRWALEHSPTHEAGNDYTSQGIFPIMGAKQLPDGRIEALVYMLEGEYDTRVYATPEEASGWLFSDGEGNCWNGEEDWYPVMPRKVEEKHS